MKTVAAMLEGLVTSIIIRPYSRQSLFIILVSTATTLPPPQDYNQWLRKSSHHIQATQCRNPQLLLTGNQNKSLQSTVDLSIMFLSLQELTVSLPPVLSPSNGITYQLIRTTLQILRSSTVERGKETEL